MYRNVNFLVFSLLLILFLCIPIKHEMNFLLVIEFLFFNLLCSFFKKEIFFSLPLFIIRVTGFFRYIVLACVMRLESESVGSAEVYTFMFFEMAAVFASVFICNIIFSTTSNNPLKKYLPISFLSKKRGVLSGGVFMMGLALCVANPSILKNMFILSRVGRTTVEFSSGFFSIILVLFTLLLFSFLVDFIERLNLSSNLKVLLLLVSSVFFVFNMSITADATSRWSMLITMTIAYFTIVKYHPEKKWFMKIFVFVAFVLTMIFGTMVKFSDVDYRYNKYNTVGESAATLLSYRDLNSYFAGPQNISYGLEVKEIIDNSNISKTTLFLSDVFLNFPLLNKYIADEKINSVRLFNNVYYGSNYFADQIIPLSSQLNIFLGYFFFIPIFFIIFVSFKLYFLLERCFDFFERYCLIYGLFSFSLVNCLNLTIFFQQLWIKIAPVFLLIWIEKKFFRKEIQL